MDEWRPIPGFPGYEAAPWGEVRSLRRRKPRSLRGQVDRWGYRELVLSQSGRQVHRSLHHLVALTFHGVRPEGHQIRHLDGDKTNNAAANLRYGTQSENQRDSVRHGTCYEAARTHCPQSHPYDLVNTYFSTTGRRECRICRRDRQRAWAARRTGRVAA